MNISKKSSTSSNKPRFDYSEVAETQSVESRIKRLNHVYKTDINQPFAIQFSTIHKAAYDGNISGILHFLDARVYIDSFDISGKAPIHIACERGHTHVVEYLLRHGSDANLKMTTDDTTPLMIACRENRLECIEFLLQNGACIFTKNRSGLAAVHFAAQSGSLECLKCIYDFVEAVRAPLDDENDDNLASTLPAGALAEEENKVALNATVTMAQRAQMARKEELLVPENVLKKLVSKEVVKKVEVAVVVEDSDRQKKEILDANNVLLEMSSNSGMRPLHFAAEFFSIPVVQFLIERKVNVNALDSSWAETALHKAARVKSFAIYRMLVAAGAQERLKNKLGETPREILYEDTKT